MMTTGRRLVPDDQVTIDPEFLPSPPSPGNLYTLDVIDRVAEPLAVARYCAPLT